MGSEFQKQWNAVSTVPATSQWRVVQTQRVDFIKPEHHKQVATVVEHSESTIRLERLTVVSQ